MFEMRPVVSNPVHATDNLAELVCSNSLGSDSPEGAPGELKSELRKLNSLIMEAADNTRVPAGQALAIDRILFSKYIEEKLLSCPGFELIRGEASEIPSEGITVIATGPLTSDNMAKSLSELIGSGFLYFYDAVSPVITAESIDTTKAFAANRYGKGTPDYLNCSMSREEYDAFYDFLINAERVDPHDFERGHFFEGCMPVEEIAIRGKQTLLFGPMKPVGLDDKAEAVVQLRKENSEGTLYSLVGFQTRLKWGEQKKLVQMIPGLENAEIVRYGVMHRNIFINSPKVLNQSFSLKSSPDVFMAGQITGVEGYTESSAAGLLAGINAWKHSNGEPPVIPPPETVLGSLVKHITDAEIENFQPMNANFGIMPELQMKAKKKDRKLAKVNRAVKAMDEWLASSEI